MSDCGSAARESRGVTELLECRECAPGPFVAGVVDPLDAGPAQVGRRAGRDSQARDGAGLGGGDRGVGTLFMVAGRQGVRSGRESEAARTVQCWIFVVNLKHRR